MKNILLALALLICPGFGEYKEIKPRVGPSFGKVFVVTVKFVEKQNSYYQQNIVTEPWLAEVISVNGVDLRKPIVIEYQLLTDSDKNEKQYAKGTTYEFMAYEDIERMGSAHNWHDENLQIPYMINQKLIMKPITKKWKERQEKGR